MPGIGYKLGGSLLVRIYTNIALELRISVVIAGGKVNDLYSVALNV